MSEPTEHRLSERPLDRTRDCLSLSAFLNAALRENLLESAKFDGGELRFLDNDGRRVRVPCRAHAATRGFFSGPVLRQEGDRYIQLPVEVLLQNLAAGGGEIFQKRVQDSIEAVRIAPLPAPDAGNWNFIEAEQALKAGHPHHPNPKSRDGMTDAESLRFAPEHGGDFALVWIRARRKAVAESADAIAAFDMLAEAEGIEARSDATHVVLPWHPWQAEKLKADESVAAMFASGDLKVIAEGKPGWRSTSSMRTIHAWHAPFMLKFSLSVRLTNSMRILSPREVVRGVQISALMRSALGAKIRDEFPTMHILGEPGFAALRNPDGTPMAESMAVLRDNPFRDAAAPGPVMLASLCEPLPDGTTPLGRMITAQGQPARTRALDWFRRFLDTAIWPLLEIRARYGLLFGAHQQNLMIDCRDGLPVASWIRDCQGTGHLRSFHDQLERYCPGLGEDAENIVDAPLGDGLVTYYVVVNSVFNTIATLALEGLAPEAELNDVWRRFLIEARARCPGDTALYARLIEQPTLTCKGNFSTSRSGVNEADGDARGQLATFLEIPNPIRQMEHA